MKVCMITPKRFPVPAVMGGAVEGLVELFMQMNEKYGKVDLTVVSCWDETAQRKSKKYKKTHMIYINSNSSAGKFYENRMVRRINSFYLSYVGKQLLTDKYIKKIHKKIKKQNYEMIIIEGGDWESYAYLIQKTDKEKLCLHIHGVSSGTALADRWFSHFICISNYVGRNLVMNGHISMDKVDIVKNGIPLELFQQELTAEERITEQRKWAIQGQETVYVYWGRLIPEKGVKELLEAFRIVSEKLPAKLLIVGNAQFGYGGKNEYDRKLEQCCEQMKGTVIFTGFVPREKLWKILKISDIAILPSVWNEPAGLAMIEAQAAGLPLITTDVGGIPEYISEESAVILSWSKDFVSDMATAMVRLAADKELRKRLTEQAFQNAEKYSAENYYHNFVAFIKKYISEDV